MGKKHCWAVILGHWHLVTQKCAYFLTQIMSDWAEIWYSKYCNQGDKCRAFKNELRIALGCTVSKISEF